MRQNKKFYFSTILIILFSACESNEDNSNIIEINKIEKNITHKETTVGCKDENRSNQECHDASAFILNTLNNYEKKSESIKDSKLITNAIETSLKEIEREEKEEESIKESLTLLVNRADSNRKKDLENFVDRIIGDESNKENSSQLKELNLIKNELKALVELENDKNSPKEIKKKINFLIEEIDQSTDKLAQTKITLNNLMDDVIETKDNSSNQFVNNMIQDVVENKITILEETENYYVVKVQEGENLSLLAKRYYHDTEKYRIIYNANRDKINSKFEIYPNTTLIIPKL